MTATPAELAARLQAHWRKSETEGPPAAPNAKQPATQPATEAARTDPSAAASPTVALSKPRRSSPCKTHLNPRDWRDAPAPNRPGWVRTACRRCGAFLGYRPVEAPKRRGR